MNVRDKRRGVIKYRRHDAGNDAQEASLSAESTSYAILISERRLCAPRDRFVPRPRLPIRGGAV